MESKNYANLIIQRAENNKIQIDAESQTDAAITSVRFELENNDCSDLASVSSNLFE